ncbi:hypothetical protein ACXGQW_06715 [Wenyingzhuangia sp. IMCC45533]
MKKIVKITSLVLLSLTFTFCSGDDGDTMANTNDNTQQGGGDNSTVNNCTKPVAFDEEIINITVGENIRPNAILFAVNAKGKGEFTTDEVLSITSIPADAVKFGIGSGGVNNGNLNSSTEVVPNNLNAFRLSERNKITGTITVKRRAEGCDNTQEDSVNFTINIRGTLNEGGGGL